MYARILAAVALTATAACTPLSDQPGLDGDTRGLTAAFTDHLPKAVPTRRKTERVYVGDALYLDGRFASAPMLVMTEGFETRLAAVDGSSLDFRLPAARLTRAHTDGRVEHYCADPGLADTLPPPGPEVCVGVRHDRGTGEVEWVVAALEDGAVRPRASGPVPQASGIRFREGRRLIIDQSTLVEEIVFDGFEDGEILFVRTVYRDGSADTETFGFPYPPRSGLPVYRIGDQAVEVMAVNDAEIEYRLQAL
jgi:hypothetical protein